MKNEKQVAFIPDFGRRNPTFGLWWWRVFSQSTHYDSFFYPGALYRSRCNPTLVWFWRKTATPESSGQAPAEGWLAFDTDTFGLWLPPTYQPDTSSSVGLFYAVDAVVNNPDEVKTILTVTSQTSNDSIEAFAAATADSLSGVDGVTLIDSAAASLGSYAAWQLVAEFEQNGSLLRQDLYLLKSDSTVWILTFTTAASEFDARSADFALTASSFFAK